MRHPLAFALVPSLLTLLACSAGETGTTDAVTDTNGDKVADALGKATGPYDIDNDGTPDGTGVDTNGDGKPDGIGIDTNGDGVLDAIDKDGDGKPDSGVGSGGSSGSGGGFTVDPGGSTGGTKTPEECNPTELRLPVVYRDFSEAHPDFEMVEFKGDVVRHGLVEPILGPNRTPAFKDSKGCPGDKTSPTACLDWGDTSSLKASITSKESFDQWYRDTDKVNMHFEKELVLTPDAATGNFAFASSSFFPLEATDGFGVTPAGHYMGKNFLFTTEIHVEFGYQKGQKFTFKGDDDVWVFVNDKLALDLGSMHGEETATIDFDAQAADLGITAGKNYNMDVFHAERHTDGSNFRIETNIGCFKPVVVVK